jgi:hypothetical protein
MESGMKGAEFVAALGRCFGGKRLPTRSIAIEVRERVEPVCAFGDARERGIHDFYRGDFFRANPGGEARDGGIVKSGAHDGRCETKLRLDAGQLRKYRDGSEFG